MSRGTCTSCLPTQKFFLMSLRRRFIDWNPRLCCISCSKPRITICRSWQISKIFETLGLKYFGAKIFFWSLSFVNRSHNYRSRWLSLSTLSAKYYQYRPMEPKWIQSALLPLTIKERTSTPQPYRERMLFFSDKYLHLLFCTLF